MDMKQKLHQRHGVAVPVVGPACSLSMLVLRGIDWSLRFLPLAYLRFQPWLESLGMVVLDMVSTAGGSISKAVRRHFNQKLTDSQYGQHISFLRFFFFDYF